MAGLEERIAQAAADLAAAAAERRHRVVTAESCTGGSLAAAITEVPGSSAWFEEGFVTYTAESKSERLDVAPEMIEREGIVSEPVAQAMARGALAGSPRATIAVGITGIAGPGGGTPDVPVGTVAIGWAERFNEHVVTCSRTIRVPGTRRIVRQQAVLTALLGLTELTRFGKPAVKPCDY